MIITFIAGFQNIEKYIKDPILIHMEKKEKFKCVWYNNCTANIQLHKHITKDTTPEIWYPLRHLTYVNYCKDL